MEQYSFLLYRASSQGAIFEVPLRRTVWPEWYSAACICVRPLRVCCVQCHRWWNGGIHSRAEPSRHDHWLLECASGKLLFHYSYLSDSINFLFRIYLVFVRFLHSGSSPIVIHRRCIPPSRPPARTRTQQARPPGRHLPPHLQRHHVAHLHFRGTKSLG